METRQEGVTTPPPQVAEGRGCAFPAWSGPWKLEFITGKTLLIYFLLVGEKSKTENPLTSNRILTKFAWTWSYLEVSPRITEASEPNQC